MNLRIKLFSAALLGTAMVAYGQTQAQPDQTTTQPAPQAAPVQHHGRSAGGDIGSGVGDAGKGAAGGVGNAAAGVGKGAGDLVTLHPINAAGAVGTGAAKGGKDVAVGAGKGTGKVVKGTGKAIKHVF
ncbi:MAG TPA: hypothetical protein VGU46_09985 [Acidobacteriaceae bacterium]|nr:hypothetical protein [Acidobacteriaceae bacterium]